MSDFFGEVVVVESEGKNFEARSIEAGFNLVTPKFLNWSKASQAGNKCPQITFVGKNYDNEKATGWDLPDGSKAKGPSSAFNAGKWKSVSEWDNPTKEMVMEFGSNLIAIFQRMSPDTDTKYRAAIKDIPNPVAEFDKFFEISKKFLEGKGMMPVWIKVARRQREDRPEFFNFDICSNRTVKTDNPRNDSYQFIVVSPSKVKTVNKNEALGLVDKITYANDEGAIKTLTWDVANKYDNKLLPPGTIGMDNSGETNANVPASTNAVDDLPF